MQAPIGVSDFRKLIETRDSDGNPYLYVDKSLFIKEILDDLIPVKLFTRPKRFGKTLNMSMLYYFFTNDAFEKSSQDVFEKLKIADHPHHFRNFTC